MKNVSAHHFLAENVAKICLQGNGKGKAKIRSKSARFSYDSSIDWEKYFWILTIYIQFKGELQMNLDWNKMRITYSGDLSRDNHFLRQQYQLKRFLKRFAKIFDFLRYLKLNVEKNDLLKNCKVIERGERLKGSCMLSQKKIMWEGNGQVFVLNLFDHLKNQVTMSFSNDDDGFYERLQLSLSSGLKRSSKVIKQSFTLLHRCSAG